MSDSPVPLGLSWNPFDNSGATPKHALGDLLSLGGIAAAALKTAAARGSISLSPDGEISSNAVVSEVTTVSISSNSAYKVQSQSPADAATAKASGKVISTAPGANGDVTVVSADDTQATNNSGSISVETKVTYANGATQTSTATLSSDFKTSGDGLARQRLDAIVGGALSTTQESMEFAGTITGGALFKQSSTPWLMGSIGESTDAVTHIPGVNAITIDRQSTQAAQFVTANAYSSVTSQSQNATQISFAGNVNDGAAGWKNEQVQLSTSDSSDESQISNADGTTSSNSPTDAAAMSLRWTPIA